MTGVSIFHSFCEKKRTNKKYCFVLFQTTRLSPNRRTGSGHILNFLILSLFSLLRVIQKILTLTFYYVYRYEPCRTQAPIVAVGFIAKTGSHALEA